MSAKKKTSRKRASSKVAKARPAKKTAKREQARRQFKKTKAGKGAAKPKKASKKPSARKAPSARRKQRRARSLTPGAVFSRGNLPSESAGQSGDLLGLSRVEGADSESVEELLEEGNAFEADVVSGVEHADDSEGREVHTHETPEDDVPQEYLDKD